MGRSVMKVVFLGVLVVAGWVGLYVYEKYSSRDTALEDAIKARLAAEAESNRLKGVVSHLQSEERRADILVIPSLDPSDQSHTTLLFQEYAQDGVSPLPPKLFRIEGNEAHIDSLVVKFKGKYVEGKDELRGRNLVLFTKLFGNRQTPEKAFVIDKPGHIPAIYAGADGKVSEFEQQIWKDFWKLAEDKGYRDQMGVDVVEGKSVWWPFKPGYRYMLSRQADADVTMRSEPIPASYQEMLKQMVKQYQVQTAPAAAPGAHQ